MRSSTDGWELGPILTGMGLLVIDFIFDFLQFWFARSMKNQSLSPCYAIDYQWIFMYASMNYCSL